MNLMILVETCMGEDTTMVSLPSEVPYLSNSVDSMPGTALIIISSLSIRSPHNLTYWSDSRALIDLDSDLCLGIAKTRLWYQRDEAIFPAVHLSQILQN